MKINEYIQSAARPAIYSPGTATMWDDEYISKQLLEVHLNPHIDLASRKPETILTTIEWLEKAMVHTGAAVLDMGCGPGLYTEELARRGYQVTGIDISANSIEYAKSAAEKKGLDIEYRKLNYLDLDDHNKYDFIYMIFTDFGVLVPDSRQRVLANINRALKPGGVFCFDFLNENYPIDDEGNREWQIDNGGFWRSGPCLVMQEKHYYEKQNVCLSQHIVTDENGQAEIYRFWTHAFHKNQMKTILSEEGFIDYQFFVGIVPDCDFYKSEEVSFCLAKK